MWKMLFGINSVIIKEILKKKAEETMNGQVSSYKN